MSGQDAGRLRFVLAALAAAIAASIPFLVAVIAWEEIVVPAYFASRGGILYKTIFFPHTPLLILSTSILGYVFGFSATLFRTMVAVTTAVCSAVIVLAVRRRGSRGPICAILVSLPFFFTCLAAVDGYAVWPDTMMDVIALLAALSLERFERKGGWRPLACGGVLLGVCILTKQTSAWLAAGALFWLLFASRRRSAAAVLTMGTAVVAPYATFVIVWAVVYRTWSHLRWTLVVPLLSGHASEIALVSQEGLGRRAPIYAATVALAVVSVRFLPAARRFRTPLPWLVASSLGMAWPRGDMLHIAAAFAIAATLVGRAAVAAELTARRVVRRHASARQVALLGSFAVVLVATILGVRAVNWKFGGPVFFWNDRASRFFSAEIRRRVPEGGAFLNFNTQYETLYAITNTTTPSGLYVHPKFWFYLNKDDLGSRLCSDLSQRPGTLVLFSYLDARRDDRRAAATCLYRILLRAPVVEQLNAATSWRVIPP